MHTDTVELTLISSEVTLFLEQPKGYCCPSGGDDL